MKNLPKEKRDRLVVIVVGTLVLMGAVYYGLISHQRHTLEDIAKKFAEEDQRVSNGQRLAATTADLQKKLQTAQGKLKGIESTMASGDMYSWIILTMNSFKENGGYKVEIPQFSREIPCDVGMIAKFPYRAAAFNVRGTAYYHDFGRFVADFENTYPYMRIQNIDLEPAGTSASTSTGPAGNAEDGERLAFKMEVITLVNPNSR
jgi:Tfp pilus assembly protein PilO